MVARGADRKAIKPLVGGVHYYLFALQAKSEWGLATPVGPIGPDWYRYH